METENSNFDSIVNLIRVANEKNSKIKNKIKFQIKEINKTKAIINQFEECLKQQNEMLNKLLDEKLAMKSYKNDLINELSKLETSDDEEYERNNYDNQDTDGSFVQINSVNIDTRNDCYKKTHPNRFDNRIQFGYYEPYGINMDKSIEVIHEDRSQINLNVPINCNDKPIKINLKSPEIIGKLLIQSDNNQSIENDYFVATQNNDRKFITLQADIKLPENENSIFENENFIKYYSPKLMFNLENESVLEIIAINNILNVCCEKGILLIYHIKNKKWTKMSTGSSKPIQKYVKFKNAHYLFCENEFVIFNEHSKTEVKEFDSNIISNMRKFRKKHLFCYISLENGEIWKYDITNEKFDKIFSFHSTMKACINLPIKFSLFLSEDGNVFITQNFKRIPELDGCVDIIASYGMIVVCHFGNGVCKIYNVENKRIIELEIFESIKFAKHSKLFLSVLDVQNRLHLYNYTENTFYYKKIQVIQIPTSKNISAISEVIYDQVYFTVENAIYSIYI